MTPAVNISETAVMMKNNDLHWRRFKKTEK